MTAKAQRYPEEISEQARQIVSSKDPGFEYHRVTSETILEDLDRRIEELWNCVLHALSWP